MAEIVINDGGSSAASDALVSQSGEYTVPMSSVVGQLVHITGDKTASIADSSGIATAPADALILAKPAAVTATLLFAGKAGVLSGLTPGDAYFLGPSGSVVKSAALPTTAGSVVQHVGYAADADTLVFFPHQPVVL